jgi:hypothetical protein
MKFVCRGSRLCTAGLVTVLFTCFALVSNVLALACVASPSGLVSWWPGDGNAVDIASGHNGTLGNGTTFTPGIVDGAFSFDGVDDYVSVPDHPSLRGVGEFTFELWANFNNVPRDSDFSNGMFLLEKDAGYILYWRPDLNRLELDIADNCDGLYHLGENVSLPTLQAGDWHHIAVTAVDTGQGQQPDIRFFFDGVQQASQDWSNLEGCGWNTNAAGELRIGSRAQQNVNPQPFNGLLDEVSFYNRALSASEIEDIFNAGSAGKCKIVSVSIDIKPGSYPNSINLGSGGTVPVAIFSSSTFDATTVIPTSVTLAGASVKLKGNGTTMSTTEDINSDGQLDLVIHVSTEALQLSETDTGAILQGQTSDGKTIEGTDTVRIVR